MKIYNRVKEQTSFSGIGNILLGGALAGFQAFGNVFINGDTFRYGVSDSINWEIGLGTYNSTQNSVERTQVLYSSNSNQLVNFPIGIKEVFITIDASLIGGFSSSIASLQELRANSQLLNYSVVVTSYYAGGSSGGGNFAQNAADTTSGWYGTGSISGTTLTIASTVNGAPAIGQQINYSGSDGSVYIASGSGTTWTLNKAPGTIATTTMTGDNGGSIIVALDGMRWYSTTNFIDIQSFGARGDANTVNDGAITSGSNVLSSASGLFKSTDVGKFVEVKLSGSPTITTTILSYTSPTSVTLNASATVNYSGASVVWGTDDTYPIKSAVSVLDDIYAPPSTYLISQQIDTIDKRLHGGGFAHTIFLANMAAGQYAAITMGLLGWTTASSTTSGGVLQDFQVQSVVNANPVIGILVSGAHNPTLKNLKTFYNEIGFYIENVSEMDMSACGSFVDNWSFIFDNRYTRTSANRPGGFAANTSNDVSSCKLSMLTSAYSQQNGMLFLNTGTITLDGLTMTVFANNPGVNAPYGLPVGQYGLHFYGDPSGNWFRYSKFRGIVFEADEGSGKARRCIRVESQTYNVAPVDNLVFDDCVVQTFSANVPTNDCTTFLEVAGPTNTGAAINIIVRNSGFTFNTTTNTYYTGKMFNMIGYANIQCDNILSQTALSNSTLAWGFNWRQLGINFINTMDVYGTAAGLGHVPTGWTGTGAYTTNLTAVAAAAWVPAMIQLSGGAGAVGMAYGSVIDFTPYMLDAKQIYIVIVYAGNLDPTVDFNVNGDGLSDFATISSANTARYGNAQYYPANTNTGTKVKIITFPEFSDNYAFKTLNGFSIGINSATGTDTCDIYYVGFGFVPLMATLNPFG